LITKLSSILPHTDENHHEKTCRLGYLKPLYIAGKNQSPIMSTSSLDALRFQVLTTRNMDFTGRTCNLFDRYQFRRGVYFQQLHRVMVRRAGEEMSVV
jgi:hypothetical protein